MFPLYPLFIVIKAVVWFIKTFALPVALVTLALGAFLAWQHPGCVETIVSNPASLDSARCIVDILGSYT